MELRMNEKDATRAILLVEDNPDDVELTLRAFEESAIANPIVVAEDGAKALELLLPDDGGPGLGPSLVLLDLKLPRVDGLSVLRAVRADERTRTQPVVVLTTSGEQQDIVESYQLGTNGYVRKPVDFLDFAAAIGSIGLFWLVINEPPPAPTRQPPWG
jgi:two-component system response regulator